MKVFDCLNERYYEKKDLIKESYDIFLKDLNVEDFDSKKDMQKEAMFTAKAYVRENTILPSQVKQWRKDNE